MKITLSAILALALIGCGKDSKGVSANLSPAAPLSVQKTANLYVNPAELADPGVVIASEEAKKDFKGLEMNVDSSGGELEVSVTTALLSKQCRSETFRSDNINSSDFKKGSKHKIQNLGIIIPLDSNKLNILLIIIQNREVVVDGKRVSKPSYVPVIFTHLDNGKYMANTAPDTSKADLYLKPRDLSLGTMACQTVKGTVNVAPIDPVTGKTDFDVEDYDYYDTTINNTIMH